MEMRSPRASKLSFAGRSRMVITALKDEVVADALRLMQARDEVEMKRARLGEAIDRGYEDAATGKTIRLESDDQIDAFFADL
jgi:hypothetical protein